jgi:glutathione S-transferase
MRARRETTMPNVVLHEWKISPFCSKVRRVLELKGIEYESVEYNGLKAALASRLSRVGKLPVLEWDGERVQDSSDIVAFLESRRPEPNVYPTDPLERARAFMLEDWADESLYWFEVYFRFEDPEARERAIELLCQGRPRFETVVFRRAAVRTLRRKLRAQGIGRIPRARIEQALWSHLDHLEILLEPTGWLVGNRQTIADIAVASQLDEILRTSTIAERVRERARVTAWLERQRPRSG